MRRLSYYLLLPALLAAVLLTNCWEKSGTDNITDPAQAPIDTLAADRPVFTAAYAQPTPAIDGMADDSVWTRASWLPLDQRWLGDPYTAEDFSGRYKIAWDNNFIYLLAEIVDDTLIDIHRDGLEKYWDDDCLEVFLDEDRSGGNHLASYQAFAYHIALDNRVVDFGPDGAPHYFDQHLPQRARTCRGDTCIWEVAVSLFDSTYTNAASDTPVQLTTGKRLGFMLAYCDNDRSAERENFIGNVPIPGEDKNRGYIDAGVFGTLILE
ncbi:MAG: sugar-binding protein [Saprospiraceae bacterium]